MKKTFIALMALAGVVVGRDIQETPDFINQKIGEAITLSGYQPNDTFTLSFDIIGHDTFGNYDVKDIVKLADNAFLMTQIGQYLGLSTSSNSNSNMTNNSSILVTNSDTKTYSLTLDGVQNSWLSYKQDTNSIVTANYGIIASYTISSDGTDTRIVIDYDGENEYTSDLTIKNFVIDINKVALADNNGMVFSNAILTIGDETYSIPEPATATLSLLALAGLAVRRRLK